MWFWTKFTIWNNTSIYSITDDNVSTVLVLCLKVKISRLIPLIQRRICMIFNWFIIEVWFKGVAIYNTSSVVFCSSLIILFLWRFLAIGEHLSFGGFRFFLDDSNLLSNSVLTAGNGSGYDSVGPFPPTKCFEQMYVSFRILLTVKYFLPHNLTQRSHFWNCDLGFGNGMKVIPSISGLFQKNRESLLQSP